MPKIKDLGIKVIPETMKPPEIGAGGGCTDCTQQAFSICGGTGGGGGCTDCTFQAFSICGGTGGGGGCTDCTFQNFSICGTTPGGGGCTDCTMQAFSICGGTCRFNTVQACGGCSRFVTVVCGPSVACRLQTHCGPFSGWGPGCGAISPVCGGSIIDTTVVQPPQTISREQIATLKDALRKQISALEEHEKTLGPKTVEEIDAREKQLNEELAQLKERRKGLK